MKRLLVILLSCWVGSVVAAEADYIGSKTCVSCHENEYKEWKKSDHFNSMAIATEETVKARFDGEVTNFHGLHFKPYRKGEEFWVESVNKKGEIEDFKVSYVFGYYPLQQMVIDIGKGHWQTHNVAWDSRPKEEGGQRWFHLQPKEKITPEHPFFWQGAYQNMNARCAECHTTDYQKNYNPEDNSYHTTWAEVNVSCETCHGPASEHVRLAEEAEKAGKKLTLQDPSGFEIKPFEPMSWRYELDKEGKLKPTAVGHGKKSDQLISTCGACHSRRTSLGPTQSNGALSYHDQFKVANLSEHLYHPDGQVADEVFVIGSFTQSKMYQDGVTCNNCHNVHTGKVKIEGNGLCAQCHSPAHYDTKEHHGHKADTEASQCVTCHMPALDIMVVDPRRDHSFKNPHPEFSETAGSPNVCQRCHEEKSNQWMIDSIDQWNGHAEISNWPVANWKAQNFEPEAEQMLIGYIKDPDLPAQIKATLYEQLAQYMSQDVIDTALADLKNPNTIIRRAAADLFRYAPENLRWQALSPLLEDKSIQVRVSATSILLEFYSVAPPQVKKILDKAIIDYKESMRETMDMPSTPMAFAFIERQKGNLKEAEKLYKRALMIDDTQIHAMVNLADLYRAEGRVKEEGEWLLKALDIVPDSAVAQHGYGLYKLRQKDYDGALKYLYEATRQVGTIPQYTLVYAVALDHNGQTDQAIKTLQEATARWEGQFQLLTTLVSYLEKQNRKAEIMAPLRELLKLAPNAPQVQQLKMKYMK